MHLSADGFGVQKRMLGPFGARVVAGELPHLGSGKQTLLLWKSRACS